MNADVLLEVRELRDRLSDRVDVLNKVKALSLLPDDVNATVEMVAGYYEVHRDAVEEVIQNHRGELESDGLHVLRGQELTEFVSGILPEARSGIVSPKARSLTLIPRRAILRIGMLLRDSVVAKTVRSYLLNVEEEARASAPQVVARAVNRISWRNIVTAVSQKKRLCKLLGVSDGTAALVALSHTEQEFGVDLSEFKRLVREDDTEETYSPTELGRRMNLPMSGKRMNRLLAEAGLQRWDEADREWKLTDAGKRYAKLMPVEIYHPNRRVSTTKYVIRWKASVLEVLRRRV
ncbi:hypothetical protein [Alicyclobacillus macrosporangiidus]|uniref:Uncharacterized protein n=1 Tax=Alicyclobacillus macrosporangiidus TaxID=392015 RepID=A0A1I7J8J8_9BACL|nr:hypothetical protein [Alicyclobacillus macrosporangiidus]SFU81498.1 hypothetical protein SAMN05421543_1096 [Alicyclobacillus macrosporangiidus]